MARSRNIKPGFFVNDELSEIEPIGRLFFIGLWTVADYQGRLEFRPKKLKAELLPYDECNINEIVKNLFDSGFIAIYTVQGRQYIEISNFTKHQNPHKNEREKGSEIPSPEMADTENDLQPIDNKELTINRDKDGTTLDKNDTDRADSLNLIPDSLNLIPESASETRFDVFWKKVSKKWHGSPGSKQEARIQFEKLNPDDELLTTMLEAFLIQRQRAADQITQGGFASNFKHVCRWLKYRCFEDNPPSLTLVHDDEDDLLNDLERYSI